MPLLLHFVFQIVSFLFSQILYVCVCVWSHDTQSMMNPDVVRLLEANPKVRCLFSLRDLEEQSGGAAVPPLFVARNFRMMLLQPLNCSWWFIFYAALTLHITKYQSDLLSNLCPTITALNLTLFLQKIVLFLYLVLQRSFSKTRSRTPSGPSSVWDLLMSPSISLLVWWTNIVFSVTQLFHRTFVNKNPSVNLTAQLTFFLLSSCMSFIALN